MNNLSLDAVDNEDQLGQQFTTKALYTHQFLQTEHQSLVTNVFKLFIRTMNPSFSPETRMHYQSHQILNGFC